MFFFKKYKNRMIVTIVAIILIVIIGITSSERVGLSKMEKIVGDVMKPLEKVFFNLGKKTSIFLDL